VLDEGGEVAEVVPSVGSLIDETIEDNQAAYNAILESREGTRRQLARLCGHCPGLIEVVCPTFSAE